MKKAEKTFFVENLTQELKSAVCVVLVDYTGLSVKMQQDLKKKLSGCNAKIIVLKNTLFRLAAKSAKVPEETLSDSVLSGPTAMIISEKDPISPLQVLAKFAKENEIINFKVGIIDGNFQDKESLVKLSLLPSKEILTAQLLGNLNGPLYGVVSVLQGNLQKLVYILREAADKK
jgi:large subunit ribosomal protein L10